MVSYVIISVVSAAITYGLICAAMPHKKSIATKKGLLYNKAMRTGRRTSRVRISIIFPLLALVACLLSHY